MSLSAVYVLIAGWSAMLLVAVLYSLWWSVHSVCSAHGRSLSCALRCRVRRRFGPCWETPQHPVLAKRSQADAAIHYADVSPIH